LWLTLTAALFGGGYYFKDELFGSVDTTVDQAGSEDSNAEKPIDTKEVKEVIEKAEAILESEAKSETAAVVEATVETKHDQNVDWNKLREDIVELLPNDNFDNGSCGPALVRLAWHSAGTYDKKTKTGGSEGAGMRYNPESDHGANAGLGKAREVLAPLKQKYPGVSYSDLWSFAGTVAIEEMGGPEMKWRPGRKDFIEGEKVVPDGRLPNADGPELAKHIRSIFNRMGFNDQEMVALIGGHALGACHIPNSGYTGPWTFSPTTFSNEFFRLLVEETWVEKTEENGKPWNGPKQYTDKKTGSLMMLPSDMELIRDPAFKKWTETYAKDEEKFFKDFAKAWIKLQENGVKKFNGWRRYIFFGPRE
jgi:cytochrome c peroxidase